MRRKELILTAAVALVLVSPSSNPEMWVLAPGGLEMVSSGQTGARLNSPSQADLDGDGQSERLAISDHGQAAILSGGALRWQSPITWRVRQALIADLNRDGRLEAVFLVWRPFKAWPVDSWLPNGGRIQNFHNSSGLSCHLIMIGWFKSGFREVWAGSALAEPIQAFAAADLTGNGRQYLVSLDGSYDDPSSAEAAQLKVWEWNGFGFTVISKIERRFDQLAVIKGLDGQTLILTR